MLPPSDLIVLARNIAVRHSLDPALICALIEQESAWSPHAMRYEPAFRARYVAPLRLESTEEIARSISWGLMQLMGQLAREHGYSGQFLSTLCDPETGVEAGCEAFAAKLARAGGNVSRGLALWNGGANPEYAVQVLARVPRYRTI